MHRTIYLTILFLIISIFFSSYYLLSNKEAEDIYTFKRISKPFLLQKREIIIDKDVSFNYDDYISFYNAEESTVSYEKTDNKLIIYVDNEIYEFPIYFKKQEILEVKKYAIISEDKLLLFIKGYRNKNNLKDRYDINLTIEDNINELTNQIISAIESNVEISLSLEGIIFHKEGEYNLNSISEKNEVHINVIIK